MSEKGEGRWERGKTTPIESKGEITKMEINQVLISDHLSPQKKKEGRTQFNININGIPELTNQPN